jgi:hypothetical protein
MLCQYENRHFLEQKSFFVSNFSISFRDPNLDFMNPCLPVLSHTLRAASSIFIQILFCSSKILQVRIYFVASQSSLCKNVHSCRPLTPQIYEKQNFYSFDEYFKYVLQRAL